MHDFFLFWGFTISFIVYFGHWDYFLFFNFCLIFNSFSLCRCPGSPTFRCKEFGVSDFSGAIPKGLYDIFFVFTTKDFGMISELMLLLFYCQVLCMVEWKRIHWRQNLNLMFNNAWNWKSKICISTLLFPFLLLSLGIKRIQWSLSLFLSQFLVLPLPILQLFKALFFHQSLNALFATHCLRRLWWYLAANIVFVRNVSSCPNA